VGRSSNQLRQQLQTASLRRTARDWQHTALANFFIAIPTDGHRRRVRAFLSNGLILSDFSKGPGVGRFDLRKIQTSPKSQRSPHLLRTRLVRPNNRAPEQLRRLLELRDKVIPAKLGIQVRHVSGSDTFFSTI